MNFDLVELLTHPAFMLLMILGLDLNFGDPVYRFHPIRIIGSLVSWYEAGLRHSGLNGKFGGVLLSLLLILSTLLFSIGIFKLLEYFHWSLSWIWYIFLGWSFLALGDLLKHARQVANAIEKVIPRCQNDDDQEVAKSMLPFRFLLFVSTF